MLGMSRFYEHAVANGSHHKSILLAIATSNLMCRYENKHIKLIKDITHPHTANKPCTFGINTIYNQCNCDCVSVTQITFGGIITALHLTDEQLQYYELEKVLSLIRYGVPCILETSNVCLDFLMSSRCDGNHKTIILTPVLD